MTLSAAQAPLTDRRRPGIGGLPAALLLALGSACWACGGRGGDAEAAPRPPLELSAAASLAELAKELAEGWERRTGQVVRVRLAGSSTLARQIEAGAPADLFLSADARWVAGLDVLARRGWLGNRLVLVSREGGVHVPLAELRSLVLAEESVPLGRASSHALRSLGVPLPERVVRGAHARDVLSKVAQGAAQAGIVYATDAALDDQVVVLMDLPDESHPPIRYEAALLDPGARELFDELGAPWVAELAARHGFLAW